MKKCALYLVLIFGALPLAAAPNPNDYTTTLHVNASHGVILLERSGPELFQELTATIDGKKYTLISSPLQNTSSLFQS